jgi:hypothetical protein
MEENKQITLYIPFGVKAEKEYFKGFGKRQIFHAVIGSACGVIVAAVIFLFSRSIPALAVIILAGIGGSIMMTMKDDQMNQSVIDMISGILRFSKAQKHFEYKQGFEWEVALNTLMVTR